MGYLKKVLRIGGKVSKILYKVNDIFQTIQGEGDRKGLLSIFIRLGQCNLRQTCWKFGGCDTEFDNFFITESSYIIYKIKEINPAIKEVVITGGEPTIQYLNDLLRELRKNSYHITLETNGILFPQSSIELVDLYSCSPKFFNFETNYDKRTHENISRAIKLDKQVQIKFVIKDDNDIKFSKKILKDIINHSGWPNEQNKQWKLFYQPHESHNVYKPGTIDEYVKLIERHNNDELLNKLEARFQLQDHKILGVE
jgi:7-carboxy-7-deazaguanine synthase